MDLSVKIAIEMDDGSLTVMAFAVRSRSPSLPSGANWLDAQGLWERPPTEENIAAEIAKAFPGVNQLGIKRPKCVKFHRIDDADLPADRAYRNAWEIRSGKVVENLDKAKEIHRDKLRNQRTERLLPLDVSWSRAMAVGDIDTAEKVEEMRQALRDAPNDPRIDKAKSIAELKRITIE